MISQLRNVRMAAAVGVVLAAGVALTGCSSGKDGDKSDAAPSATVTSADAGATPTAGSDTAATPTSAPASAPATKAGNGGTGDSAGSSDAAARCRTADLGFSFGPDSGAQAVGSPGGIGVVMTNKGSGTCSLKGFPGVDIVSASGTHWSLTRQAKSTGKVTLKPGSAASFEITYLPFDAGNSGGSVAFHAASILVTPPDETHSTTLKWDGFADVMDQSGATHPGTYVGPVVAGNGE
ncbi:DUF4232 domain-containing protein [Streptomyces sp. NRRL F-5123]|uniref:DUF4232 domain-containing protein n=1 Tax=Streptomyces sp. NRRL F-5123 TaxID=1463856 RepID=UPI0004E13CC6|nr:DUF4232 domain-containing protein [Streptomyces sp. NRRL F-5123]